MSEEKIVTIYSCNEELEAERLASILKNEGIDSYVQNKHIQDLFGIGRMGPGYNTAIGMFHIQVRESDADSALVILSDMIDPGENHIEIPSQADEHLEEEKQQQEPDATKPEEQKNPKYWAISVVLSLLWGFGIGSVAGIYYGIKGFKTKPVFSVLGIIIGIAGICITFIGFSWHFPLGVLILVTPIFCAFNGYRLYRKTRKTRFLILAIAGLVVLCGYAVILILTAILA